MEVYLYSLIPGIYFVMDSNKSPLNNNMGNQPHHLFPVHSLLVVYVCMCERWEIMQFGI